MAALPVDPEDGAQSVAAAAALDPSGTGQAAAPAAPAAAAAAAAAAVDTSGNTKNFTTPQTAPAGLSVGDPRTGTERSVGDANFDDPSGQAEGPPSPPVNAQGAPGQPRQAVAVSSEPTPQTPKINNGLRYLELEKRNPQLKVYIDHAAQAVGVPPTDLANIAWVENRFKSENAPDSNKGAIGPMQVMEATAHGLDPTGHLDIRNTADNVLLGAMAYKQVAERYGMSTPGAFGAYFAGSPKYDMAAANPGKYPQLLNQIHGYINAINSPTMEAGGGDGGATEARSFPVLNTAGHITPQGIVQSARQGGPDGFMQYVAANGPQGMGMSDLWRNAEAQLVGAFVSKGDMAGAQHARDFILQLSHTGANMYLMQANNLLQAGDGVGAASALAKSHAFFPDGTIGRFRSNGTNVWAERVDENNPDQRVGQSFQVTPQNIAAMLNQTTDPQTYLKTLNEQQAATAKLQHESTMSSYYAGINPTREAIADKRVASSAYSADTRAAATVQAANIRAGAAGAKPDLAYNRMVEKETNEAYDPAMSPDQTPEGQHQFAIQGSIYRALRQENVSGPQSKVLSDGLASGKLMMRPTTDGRMGVVDDKGNALTYLPGSVMGRLGGQPAAAPTPAAPPNATPVGASAATPVARAAGVGMNLSGTTMPQQQQPQPQQ